jgi:hypothetical protein
VRPGSGRSPQLTATNPTSLRPADPPCNDGPSQSAGYRFCRRCSVYIRDAEAPDDEDDESCGRGSPRAAPVSFQFGHTVSKQPEAAVAVLHNDVLPFYHKLHLPVRAVLIDNGREFCGTERHPHAAQRHRAGKTRIDRRDTRRHCR